MMSAGRHSSWRSVSHKKSSRSRSFLPVSGDRRVPRPTIWLYRLRTLVGRSTTMQSTLGQSQPSVSSMLLHRTLYLPFEKSDRISARSSLCPFTSAARNPLLLRMSRNFWLVLISGRNTTVFRPAHAVCISDAICSRYGSSAVPSPPTAKSPPLSVTWLMSSCSGMVWARIGHRYPSRIACVSLYS